MKIAIIGARGYQTEADGRKVVSFAWNRVADIKNLADYDTIIINLVSLNPAAVDWASFVNVLNLQTMKDVLLHEGRFIVIGDPRFTIPSDSSSEAKEVEQPFLRWTGMEFIWDDLPGDTVDFHGYVQHPVGRGSGGVFSKYEGYVEHLKTWKYCLRGVRPNLGLLKEILNLREAKAGNEEIEATLFGFATNRYDCSLAFSANLTIYKTAKSYGSTTATTLIEFGPIVFLPETTLSEHEALRLILKDICKVTLEQPEPDWIERMIAPGQEAADKDIEAIRSEVTSLVERMEAAQTKRADIRAPLRLLYDGGDSLEDAVRDVLRRMGAEVEDPADPGKEDGWLTVEIDGKPTEAVLEVKGTDKAQFPEAGLRQLMEWKNRGIQLRQNRYKGIFVGNNALATPPEERPGRAFSDQWIKTAELAEIAALLSKDLYQAYFLHQSGRLDINEFWRRLFATNGVFDAEWLYGLPSNAAS